MAAESSTDHDLCKRSPLRYGPPHEHDRMIGDDHVLGGLRDHALQSAMAALHDLHEAVDGGDESIRRAIASVTTTVSDLQSAKLCDPDGVQGSHHLASELALRASQERFRLLVDDAKDYAIFLLDTDGRVASWNAGAQRVEGYRAEEIIGRHFSVFYTPEDLASGRPASELEIAASSRLAGESWRVRKDGSRFWANITITALRGPDGILRGYSKATYDLTERRAAENALRVVEERFRFSFDQALIGMSILDLQGRYQRVNAAFCAIVGYSNEEMAGLSRESITHPDDTAGDAAALRSLLAGEETSHSGARRYLHADGHTVRVETNVTLIRDADGAPLHFIAQVQDVTERHAHEQQLQHMADHDPLTGLLNRRSFNRELSSHVSRARRYGATGALLILDIDHFKYFNDTQGHSAGDQLIVRISRGLRGRLRDSDVIARLGGDEFVVLLPDGDERATQLVADALLQVVRDEAMPALMSGHKRVTASIGIAHFQDGDCLTAEEMMFNADRAMYEAKDNGSDRSARYRAEQHGQAKTATSSKWAEQINDALARDAFELLAQPIVPLAANGSPRYELLLRMRGQQGRLITPGSFVEIAERLGLIGEIDRWVTARAIDMLAEHRALGRDLCFEVNLSGHSIGQEALLEFIERRLAETGVPADRLIFELPETAAIAHIGRATLFAERLAKIGCGFALDDFGASLGSFYYLKHLPFDYLKIDGEFVRHCATNATDRILIAAVAQIAHGMGKRTVAEFVTNQETVEVLTGLGVDYGQGFYLGRPLPLTDQLVTREGPSTGRTGLQ